jgi:hypothetical protein
VERLFNQRNNEIDFDITIDIDSLSNQINRHTKQKPRYDLQFFSDATLKIPITNVQSNFKRKPKYSKTFKSINNNLFTNSPNELLFYQNEINNLKIKNDALYIMRSIEVIEQINDKVKKQNMQLIMLVSPDKYDLYFNYIKENNHLIKPLFFEFYEHTEHN